MVIGEGQIAGQLRSALKTAQANDTVDQALNEVVQQALRVGKRVRNETGIDRAGASLVSVGLSRAGSLEGRRALVVGAGSMSSLAVATLAREGIGEVIIANRTYERGAHLARSVEVPARAIELADLRPALAEADIVVSCTGSTGLVITPDMIETPVFLLDLALPHDVDPAVRDLPGVTLVGLSDLRDADDATVEADSEAVRRIVCEEVHAFQLALIAATVAPTVVALRSKAAEVVDAELGRLGGRLPGLDDKARDEIAQTVRRVVDKLLHAPTVRVKELAASADGDTYTEALRELFDLDPKAPEAVIRAEDVL
jgi:glutamyl-tRNA reductase